ncbi:hypothetical protein [Bradyrhizobium sp. HKCCYLS3013]|uniref:hypothetical protein n=1 Tax=Bradyrhizobium sp. HKCCYLS3013 TaxID=3420735 RepID=UPI003EC0F32B
MIALCFISRPEHLLISFSVMPGLVPGIHVFPRMPNDVDGRDKPGHDDGEASVRIIQVAAYAFAVAQGAESTRKSRQSDLLFKVQP